MLEEIAKALSEIEVQVLKALKNGETLSEETLAEKAHIPVDSVRRALAWLKEKGLANVEERHLKQYRLTKKGELALKKGLPEELLINALKELGGTARINELFESSGLSRQEFNAALGKVRRYNLIVFNNKGELTFTGLEDEYLKKNREKELLKRVNAKESIDEEGFAFVDIRKRGLIEKKERIVRYAGINDNGMKALNIASSRKERAYNLAVQVEPLAMGKKQPYARFLDEVRKKLVAMGFKEMKAPCIVQEFYNFDVLFQPQNHAARDWTSTFRLKYPNKGALPKRRVVDAVKAAHENGAGTGSRGWRYSWSVELAKRLMPTAHGTAHSARQLVEGVEIPGKYFALARCYRPDVVDKTHLMEFNQLEGIIAADLSFKHLLGMLKEFAEEIAGAKQVKFYPDYYPFTEPSVQLSAKHEELGWIEFGGAGLFRPEMLKPLGIDCNVLAWGLGIDTLAMFKLGIDDMRELFSSNLDWLRKHEIVRL